jgi:hypothetical protein
MTSKTRYAVIEYAGSAASLQAYLPVNYRLASDELERFVGSEGTFVIEGEDVAGWTLDGYVIPRLASGLITAREQFLHMEDDGDGESGPHLSVWLEDFPMGTKVEEQVEPCAICGEPVRPSDDDAAEMHDASMLSDPEMFSEAEGGIVHAECGIAKGWQVS